MFMNIAPPTNIGQIQELMNEFGYKQSLQAPWCEFQTLTLNVEEHTYSFGPAITSVTFRKY